MSLSELTRLASSYEQKKHFVWELRVRRDVAK